MKILWCDDEAKDAQARDQFLEEFSLEPEQVITVLGWKELRIALQSNADIGLIIMDILWGDQPEAMVTLGKALGVGYLKQLRKSFPTIPIATRSKINDPVVLSQLFRDLCECKILEHFVKFKELTPEELFRRAKLLETCKSQLMSTGGITSVVARGKQPRAVVFSSQEGIRYAEALGALLNKFCEATVWTHGLFLSSEVGIESLESRIKEFDVGVIILTRDDTTSSRGKREISPRDNVVFELGFVMGALGRLNTFVVRPDGEMKIPTDLLGLNEMRFTERPDKNIRAELNSVQVEIRESLARRGKI